MSIRVTCSACQRTFKVKDRFAGLKGSCLYCGRVVSVPMSPPTPADFEVLEEAEEDEMLGSSLSLSTYVPMTECPACHKEIIEGSTKCFYCGAELPDEVQAEYVRGDEVIREQIHHEKGRKCVVAYAESDQRVYFFIDTTVDDGSIVTQIHASDTPYEKQKNYVGQVTTPVSGEADNTHLSKVEDAINGWLEKSEQAT